MGIDSGIRRVSKSLADRRPGLRLQENAVPVGSRRQELAEIGKKFNFYSH